MSSSVMRPLGDNILIKRRNSPETTESGIVIPDSAREKMNEGTVVALGDGKLLDNGNYSKPNLKIGDRILFGKYAGSEFQLDGEEHIVLKTEDILGVFES